MESMKKGLKIIDELNFFYHLKISKLRVIRIIVEAALKKLIT
jgi:hypothetical protein